MINGVKLKQAALEYESVLNDIKRNIKTNIRWYPYGTLNNFIHLEECFNVYPLEKLVSKNIIADIGAADGDLAFFLNHYIGNSVDIIDHGPTNYNGLQGARALVHALGVQASVFVHEIDIDNHFFLPRDGYDLVFFLGILYHLKNPFYVLENLSRKSRHLILSTRVARYTPDGQTIAGKPLVYLLHPTESNNDATNYWIFSEYALERLVGRAGWDILYKTTVGDRISSNPSDPQKDERSFMLLRSRYI